VPKVKLHPAAKRGSRWRRAHGEWAQSSTFLSRANRKSPNVMGGSVKADGLGDGHKRAKTALARRRLGPLDTAIRRRRRRRSDRSTCGTVRLPGSLFSRRLIFPCRDVRIAVVCESVPPAVEPTVWKARQGGVVEV